MLLCLQTLQQDVADYSAPRHSTCLVNQVLDSALGPRVSICARQLLCSTIFGGTLLTLSTCPPAYGAVNTASMATPDTCLPCPAAFSFSLNLSRSPLSESSWLRSAVVQAARPQVIALLSTNASLVRHLPESFSDARRC